MAEEALHVHGERVRVLEVVRQHYGPCHDHHLEIEHAAGERRGQRGHARLPGPPRQPPGARRAAGGGRRRKRRRQVRVPRHPQAAAAAAATPGRAPVPLPAPSPPQAPPERARGRAGGRGVPGDRPRPQPPRSSPGSSPQARPEEAVSAAARTAAPVPSEGGRRGAEEAPRGVETKKERRRGGSTEGASRNSLEKQPLGGWRNPCNARESGA